MENLEILMKMKDAYDDYQKKIADLSLKVKDPQLLKIMTDYLSEYESQQYKQAKYAFEKFMESAKQAEIIACNVKRERSKAGVA